MLRAIQIRQEVFDKRCLSSTNLARHHDEAFALRDAEFEESYRLAVLLAAEKNWLSG